MPATSSISASTPFLAPAAGESNVKQEEAEEKIVTSAVEAAKAVENVDPVVTTPMKEPNLAAIIHSTPSGPGPSRFGFDSLPFSTKRSKNVSYPVSHQKKTIQAFLVFKLPKNIIQNQSNESSFGLRLMEIHSFESFLKKIWFCYSNTSCSSQAILVPKIKKICLDMSWLQNGHAKSIFSS